jgi:hypothetical protein
VLLSLPIRAASGLALMLVLGTGVTACGGDDNAADTDSTAPAGDDSSQDTSPSADDGDAASIPDDVCALLSADEVGAVLGETVEAQPAPQGGCSYNGESRESLYPNIYLEDAADSDITGVGDPISVDGHDGFIRDSGAATGASVFEGVLVVDDILVRVVVNSDDMAGQRGTVIKLLELTASKL